ncbi:MAG: hypothetical protein ACYC96_07465 [Fimbriimonadaceae bacterium]
MLRVGDWLRRSLIYALTFVLGFLGALTLIASFNQPETTIFLPMGFGLLFFMLLGLLPPFKNVVLRLALTAVVTSGSLAAWFISEPPAASEPNHRLSVLVPILGITGPALCIILVLLLSEERKVVSRPVWKWLALVVVMTWLVSFYSASHNVSGVVLLRHGSFRFNSDIGQTHALAHRGILQIICFGMTTAASVGLAASSRASAFATGVVGLLFPSGLALFDEGRCRIEFAEHFARRSLAIDGVVILAALLVTMAMTSPGRRRVSASLT